MNYQTSNPFVSVAEAAPATRAEFIRKTYTHLAIAILAFIGLEFVLFSTGIAHLVAQFVFSLPYGFMILLGGFMVVAWMSQSMASGSATKGKQYAGMGLYVFAEAIIFAPILLLAATQAPGVITSGTAPTRVATMGNPAASASSRAIGMPSLWLG